MANSDKDIVIRPRKGDASLNPVIEFVGADSGTGPQTITATVTPANQGTVTFSGTSGTILTIADNATDKLNVNGNLTVGGNLTVSGSTTTINTETINLADNIIVLNSNEAGTPSQNAGIEIERGTSTNVILQWNETSDHWEIASGGTTGRILTTGDEGTGNGLDADTVDSIQGASLLRSDASDSYTSGTLTFNSGTTLTAASGATVNFNNTTGTAPFTVSSTTVVTNLNADLLDGVQGSAYLRSNTSDTFTGTLTMAGNILPEADNTRNLGSSTLKFNTVYATTFEGTATSAQYADLAEIYSTDHEYEPGTVVMFGGESELTQTDSYATTRVAGVISTDPAFLMNKDAVGQPIALKGRVPCKVVGKVSKGDMLISSAIPGVATTSEHWIGGAMIGKAIESSDEVNIKVIEIAVGVL
jgi:hypothetical protein